MPGFDDAIDLGTTGLVDLTTTPATFDDNPFTLSPGEQFPDPAPLTQNAANSANGTLTITHTINDGAETTVSATANSAAPITGASCTAFDDVEKGKLADLGGSPRTGSRAPRTRRATRSHSAAVKSLPPPTQAHRVGPSRWLRPLSGELCLTMTFSGSASRNTSHLRY